MIERQQLIPNLINPDLGTLPSRHHLRIHHHNHHLHLHSSHLHLSHLRSHHYLHVEHLSHEGRTLLDLLGRLFHRQTHGAHLYRP